MRIGSLAEQLGSTPHTIRFYELRGLPPAPPRGNHHYRDYGEADTREALLRLRHPPNTRRLVVAHRPLRGLMPAREFGRAP